MALLFAGAGAACSDECSVPEAEVGNPFPSFECGAGELCYLGTCLDACLAGLERTEECQRASDCDAARPFCVDDFCSACESGFSCVPSLNLCRPITPVPELATPQRPSNPEDRPPGPLDASLPDQGLSRYPDLGFDEVDEREVTWAVNFYLARETTFSGGTQTSTSIVRVDAWDTEGTGPGRRWRPEFEPPRIETIARDEEGIELRDLNCEIRVLNTPTVAISRGDFGSVSYEDDTDDDRYLFTDYDLNFGAGTYRATPRGPTNPETFRSSIPLIDIQGQVALSGSGAGGVTLGPYSRTQHIPFRFELNEATIVEMRTGYVLPEDVGRDLVFGWRDPLVQGTLGGEVVFVQIDASDADDPHELTCQDGEGSDSTGSIVIRLGLLREFRRRVGSGREFPVRVGRRNTLELSIAPAPDERIQAVTTVSQHFRSTLRFSN